MRAFLAFIFLTSGPLFAQQPTSFRNALVKVFVHKQDIDVHEPWKNGRVFTEEHVGTVVNFDQGKEKGILIKASALAFAKRIEMQVVSQSELIELVPRFIDYEVNLALLETSESELLDSLHSIPVSDQELPIEEEVYLYKIESGNHVSRTRSLLRQVNVGERVDISSFPTINYVFKVSRKELGWSEPIISKGRLVALAVGEDDDDNVHAIAGPMLFHFLNDDLDDDYAGFPTVGIEYVSLSSPHTREALGIGKMSQGVLITDLSSQSPFVKRLKRGDVLLAVDGKPINSNGNILHPLWGEIPSEAMLYKHYAGDKITIEVLKDKKRQKFIGELKRYDSNAQLIPYYNYTEKVNFLVVGGLVLQELTRSFIRAWGKNWLGDAPSSFAYLWAFKNVETTANERVIILNQVLADQVNTGYEGIGNAIVKSVNGKEIHSFSDLEEALKKPVIKDNEPFAQIKLDYGEGEVILPMKALAEANERIGNNYGVYDKKAFFTPPPFSK